MRSRPASRTCRSTSPPGPTGAALPPERRPQPAAFRPGIRQTRRLPAADPAWLCTYGITCRAVLQAVTGYDPDQIMSHQARFSAPVFPGRRHHRRPLEGRPEHLLRGPREGPRRHRHQERPDRPAELSPCETVSRRRGRAPSWPPPRSPSRRSQRRGRRTPRWVRRPTPSTVTSRLAPIDGKAVIGPPPVEGGAQGCGRPRHLRADSRAEGLAALEDRDPGQRPVTGGALQRFSCAMGVDVNATQTPGYGACCIASRRTSA
jgi:hypothetical protein